MKRLTIVLLSLSLACVALIGIQAALTQRSAFALELNDVPSGVSQRLPPGEPITTTDYFTSYLPIIVGPEALVTGNIAEAGVPVANVTISTSVGLSATTDANGDYQIRLPDGSHTLTPTLAGYTFSPTFRLVTVPPNATGLDFEATPPPCAPGQTIFFDNFSNANSGWGTDSTEAWSRAYIEGEYEATLHVNTELFHAAPGIGNTLGNLVVSADLRQTDAPEYGDGYGLWIGSISAGKYYEFAICTNTMFCTQSNYGVVYYDSTEPIWLGKGGGVSSAINMGNGTNTLKVQRCGSQYYFYANGALLRAYLLPELANQNLATGYYVRAVHNATIRLDNFRVQNVTP